MTIAASMKGVSVNLLSAVTGTVSSDSIALPITSYYPQIIITGSGTISGGTVLIEESDEDEYTGTWSLIQSITASGLNGGAKQIVHILATVRFIRVRVSSAILGGGNISADLVSN